ncbi:receptor-like protein EIX2 isoform X2 [Prunus dulcis]|uniref:receptor-like protein EIX2 isoform X2 n=1 Tax=Prunus dulcis TaxID=3755 RepID=UPI001482F10E|nr:receptor-like protein EIX2 isoform X2 [Prunus dulcis]
MQGHGRCLKLFLAFALLLVQYAKGGEVDHSHRDTNVTGRCIERERKALLAFKRGLVDKADLLSSWGSEAQKQDCCRWVGVSCSNQTGHVIQVDLHGLYSLQGSLSFLCSSAAIGLGFLDLSNNNVSGQVPDCLTYLTNLVMLDLSYNALSGKIPTTIGSVFWIETLKLRSNGFVGQLPSSLKNCTSLKVIDVGDNKLSGPIPKWLGVGLKDLVILMLSSNHFNGSLPLTIMSSNTHSNFGFLYEQYLWKHTQMPQQSDYSSSERKSKSEHLTFCLHDE